MSGYPRNRYSYQRNDNFSSNRLHFSDHSQVRRPPPVPMHFQDGRFSGNAPFDITGPFGIAPNAHERMLPRPPYPDEKSWTHHQGQENHYKYRYDTRFSQPSNTNHNQTEISNEGANTNFNTLMPPIPQWANANTFHGIRPPPIPVPPPNILPNTYSHQLGPQSLRKHTPWTAAMSPTGTYANHQKEKDNQDTSDRLFVKEWLSKRNIHETVDGNEQKVVKVISTSICIWDHQIKSPRHTPCDISCVIIDSVLIWQWRVSVLSFSVQKNVSTFPCNSEVLQYQQIIQLLFYYLPLT